MTAFTFFVRSSIFSNGRHWEDGSPLEGISFYVVAQDAKGNRWAYSKTWSRATCHNCWAAGEQHEDAEAVVCKTHQLDPKAGRYSDEEAEAEAAKVISRFEAIAATGKWVGPKEGAHWSKIDPCYGSEAYSGSEDLARELHEEMVPMNEWPSAAW